MNAILWSGWRARAGLLFVGLMLMASQPSHAQTPEKLELHYQGWASKVLYPELAEDLGYLAPVKLTWVGNTTSGPQDIQAAVTGDVDFGGAFNGSIVKLVAAHAPVKAVISYVGADKDTNGGLFVLQGSPIKTAHDLVGHKVGVNTPGAYAQYLVTAWLEKSGVSKEDIQKITFVAALPVNLEQLSLRTASSSRIRRRCASSSKAPRGRSNGHRERRARKSSHGWRKSSRRATATKTKRSCVTGNRRASAGRAVSSARPSSRPMSTGT